jgi:hypothetical protein
MGQRGGHALVLRVLAAALGELGQLPLVLLADAGMVLRGLDHRETPTPIGQI